MILGVVRLLMENLLSIDTEQLVATVADVLVGVPESARSAVEQFSLSESDPVQRELIAFIRLINEKLDNDTNFLRNSSVGLEEIIDAYSGGGVGGNSSEKQLVLHWLSWALSNHKNIK